MIQNSFRSNFSIIGILLATALGGAEGGSIAASMQAPTIIYFNVVSVLCLIYFSDQPQRRVSPGYILKSIATNPMILGQVVGLACLIARQWIPRDASGELLFSIQGSLPFPLFSGGQPGLHGHAADPCPDGWASGLQRGGSHEKGTDRGHCSAVDSCPPSLASAWPLSPRIWACLPSPPQLWVLW